MQVRRQQLEPDMEQQTGSKSGKEYVKAVYCHNIQKKKKAKEKRKDISILMQSSKE